MKKGRVPNELLRYALKRQRCSDTSLQKAEAAYNSALVEHTNLVEMRTQLEWEKIQSNILCETCSTCIKSQAMLAPLIESERELFKRLCIYNAILQENVAFIILAGLKKNSPSLLNEIPKECVLQFSKLLWKKQRK